MGLRFHACTFFSGVRGNFAFRKVFCEFPACVYCMYMCSRVPGVILRDSLTWKEGHYKNDPLFLSREDVNNSMALERFVKREWIIFSSKL